MRDELMEIAGTRVLLTGAAGGVGLETARCMIARGWSVVATVLDQAEADALATAVPGLERIVTLDLADGERVLAEVRALVVGFDRLDHVVCCAGLSDYHPLELMPLARARRMMDVNAFANLALYQACVARLRERGGRMLFVSSMGGRMSMPMIGGYCASKFALEALADAMRRECRGTGVEIILVEPGSIRTPMLRQQIDVLPGDLARLTSEEYALYGALFENYGQLSARSQAEGAVSPRRVAETIVAALDAGSPQARYVVGDDAEALIGMLGLPDTEIDAALEATYAAAALA